MEMVTGSEGAAKATIRSRRTWKMAQSSRAFPQPGPANTPVP